METTIDDIIAFLKSKACAENLPWTAENPHEDHGHSDCNKYWDAIDLIEMFMENMDRMMLLFERMDALLTKLNTTASGFYDYSVLEKRRFPWTKEEDDQ